MSSGSSPLARGLPADQAIRVEGERIIPARAGFTTAPAGQLLSPTDHPRSRGVYMARLLRKSCAIRIIPARAGFTARLGPSRCPGRDHPRSRGVYASDRAVIGPPDGSSPLARGLPSFACRRARRSGIIPARAGFTLADPWNPNDEPCYQTAFTFSANLEPAPPSSGSAVVLRRSTMTPSEA